MPEQQAVDINKVLHKTSLRELENVLRLINLRNEYVDHAKEASPSSFEYFGPPILNINDKIRMILNL